MKPASRLFVIAFVWLLEVSAVRAADPAAPEATAAPGPVAEAQAHFKRGVDLYNDGDVPAAQVEFRRAYALVPNYRVLYNLGRVAADQHDYAAAIRSYDQYLADGGPQLAPIRRDEVEAELQRLRGRVGLLRVVVDLAGAEVSIDDVAVGTSPLTAPVLVNAGKRRVVVTARHLPPLARVVEIAGEETLDVAFTLDRPAPRAPAVPPPPLALAASSANRVPTSQRRNRSAWPVTLAWTATGLAAAGAAFTGVLALQKSHDLGVLRESYPASAAALEQARQRARTAAFVTDGLLTGAAILATISIYISFRSPGDSTTLSLGPGSVELSGRF